MSAINFDKMSNQQLTELVKQARGEVRRQSEQRDALKTAQIEAEWSKKIEDLGADTPEQQISDEPELGGWDESMLVSEHRGDRSGNQLLQRITEFVNLNSSDPDVAQYLPVDATVFEVQSADYPDYTLVGQMERKKWRVSALNERDEAQSFKFVLGNDFDRETAIEAASRELEKYVGPKFRELSATDSNLIQRTAVNDRNEAMLLYLRARLPLEWAQELERLIAQSELRGNASKVLEYVSQPRIHPILEEAIEACWAFSRPHLQITEEMKDFFSQRTRGVVLSYPLLDSLLKQFQINTTMNQLGSQPPPSTEDLNDLTDAEIEELHRKTRIEFARQPR